MENLTNSSEAQENPSNDSGLALIMSLYDAREKMPMQAEEAENDREKDQRQD